MTTLGNVHLFDRWHRSFVVTFYRRPMSSRWSYVLIMMMINDYVDFLTYCFFFKLPYTWSNTEVGIKLKISNHKKTDSPDSIVLAPTTLTNFFLNNLTGLHLFYKSVSVIDDTDGYHQLIPIGVLGKAYQWVSTDDTSKILGVRQHYYCL